MTRKLDIYKCSICGNTVEIMSAGKGELVCCNKPMELIEAKTAQAEGKEKHVPQIEKNEQGYTVSVGSTEHPMTDEHFIQWLDIFTTENMFRKCFNPGDKPSLTIKTDDEIVEAKAFCNVHGLWINVTDAVKIINVADYDKAELILMALKSEIDSEHIYRTVAKRVDNAFLKMKMTFLADEEKKHKEYFESFFKETFPDKSMDLPDTDFAPLPDIDMTDDNIPASHVLRRARQSEKAAHDFYIELSKLFSDNLKLANMLKFFASMEMIHYAILTEELKNIERDEDYLGEWPMVHVGP